MKLADLTKPKTKRIKMTESTPITDVVESSIETTTQQTETDKPKTDETKSHFSLMEPLKNNRFLISFPDINIPNYLFRSYEMYNEGENLIFTTEILETVDFTFNPKDFFKITSVKLEYLDPVGEVVGGLVFNVKGSNFKKTGNYSDDGLQTNSFIFLVDIDSIQNLFEYGK